MGWCLLPKRGFHCAQGRGVTHSRLQRAPGWRGDSPCSALSLSPFPFLEAWGCRGLTLTLHRLGPGHIRWWRWWVYVLKLPSPCGLCTDPAPGTRAGPRRELAGRGRGRGPERLAAWAPDCRREGVRSCAGDPGSPGRGCLRGRGGVRSRSGFCRLFPKAELT